MGAYVAGMFHLITHAFFKALLFLGSGSVIHGMEHGHHHVHDHTDHGAHDDADIEADSHDDFDPQDMRTMGGLRQQDADHLLGLHGRRPGAGRHSSPCRLLVEG